MSTSDPVILELERKIDKINQDISAKKREKQVKEQELDRKKREMQKVEAEVTAIQSETDGLIRNQHKIKSDMKDMQTRLERELDKAA